MQVELLFTYVTGTVSAPNLIRDVHLLFSSFWQKQSWEEIHCTVLLTSQIPTMCIHQWDRQLWGREIEDQPLEYSHAYSISYLKKLGLIPVVTRFRGIPLVYWPQQE